MSEEFEVLRELVEARVVSETRAPADEDVRTEDFDPFHHTRNRLGQFRDVDDKMRDMQVGAYIDLFKFIRRDSLPDVTSGRLTKTANGYAITIIQDEKSYTFSHIGNLDKPGFLYLLQKIKKSVDEHRQRASVGLSGERIRPMSDRPTNVSRLPKRRVHKPTDRVDDVVIEQNGGFTPTGADTIENVAGDPDGAHWVLGVWDPVEFQTYDLSPADRNFLTKHVAAIAYKVRPGVDPEIDYFTSADFAKKRMSVLRSKYGVPEVTGIRPVQ